jgi:hypothetical protein
MKNISVIIAILLTAASVNAKTKWGNDQRKSIRIYICAKEASESSGFVDPDQKDLADSVEDVSRFLKAYTIVDNAGGADVTLRIVKRSHVASGKQVKQQSIFGEATATSTNTTQIEVRLSVKGYTTTIDGQDEPGPYTPNGTWKGAAAFADKHIDDWIKANYDKILAVRAK